MAGAVQAFGRHELRALASRFGRGLNLAILQKSGQVTIIPVPHKLALEARSPTHLPAKNAQPCSHMYAAKALCCL